MAEVIQTDLTLNIGPFKSQIDEAVKGMEGYVEVTDEATKGNKAFDNSLGQQATKLNNVKAAADGVAQATGKVASEQAKVASSGGLIGNLSKAWTTVKSSVSGAASTVVSFVKGARDGVKGAIGDVGGLRGIFSQLGTGVKNVFSGIGKSVSGIGANIKGLIPQVGGLGGSLLGLLGPAGIAAGAIAAIGGAFISNIDAGATFFDGVARSGGIVFDKLTGVFKRVVGAIGDVWDALTDGETTIGKVFGFFSTVVQGVIAPLTTVISLVGELTGISDALADAAAEGQALAQAYDDIDEAQTKNIKANAELEAQIKKLEVQLRNRTTSEEERLAIGEQIGKLEEERAANELSVLQKITAAKRKEAENELKNKAEVSDETARALAEAEAAEINALSDSVNRTERAQNRIDQIRQQGDAKRKAAAEKAAAEAKKIAEGRLAVEQDLAKAEAALLGEREKAERAALDTRNARVEKAAGDARLLIQIEEAYNAELQSIRDKAAADAEAVANKQAQALQAAQLSASQERLARLKEEQDIDLKLAQQAGENVSELLNRQYEERAALEASIQEAKLEQLQQQYEEDYAALDGNLIAQYDRLAQFELDKAALLNESSVSELDAKRELLDQTAALERAEEELTASRVDAAASAGQIISQLAGESEAAAALGFAAQKAAAIAQVITTTNAGIAAANAAAAAVPVFLPLTGLPNPAYPVAQAAKVATIASLKIGAATNLAQILAQSVSGFDSGGLITGSDGPRITKQGGDNVLITGKTGEIILNEGQQRRLKQLAGDNVFGDIGVPGFSKTPRRSIFLPPSVDDIENNYRWISSMGAVNSYVEGRGGDVIHNTTSYSRPIQFSDKRMVGAIGQSTKEARRQTEILASIAKRPRRANKRYYA